MTNMMGENWHILYDDKSDDDIHIVSETEDSISVLFIHKGDIMCGIPQKISKESIEFIKKVFVK